MGGGMSTRREYFRIRCYARVGLRTIDDVEESAARARVRTRSIPRAFAPGALEGQSLPSEQVLTLDLLKYIALSLDRIERRIDDVARQTSSAHSDQVSADAPVEICLSAAGFAGSFGLDLPDKTLVEVQLDLGDAGLPPIWALARVVTQDPGATDDTAFSFEEILPDDRERLVQLALRSQTQAIRKERSGELE